MVPVVTVVATWLTGFWQSSFYHYGFPLPWKTTGCLIAQLDRLTHIIGPNPCPSIYSVYWGALVLDTIFYAGIGYVFPTGLTRANRRLSLSPTKPVRAETMRDPSQD